MLTEAQRPTLYHSERSEESTIPEPRTVTISRNHYLYLLCPLCILWLSDWKLTTMCKVTPLQQKIRKRTGNGDLIVNFLANTVEGKYPDAKYRHRLEATKQLIRFDFSEEEHSHFWGLLPTPEELAAAPSRH